MRWKEQHIFFIFLRLDAEVRIPELFYLASIVSLAAVHLVHREALLVERPPSGSISEGGRQQKNSSFRGKKVGFFYALHKGVRKKIFKDASAKH